MARYVKELPMVDSQANTFSQIQRYLTQEGYEYRVRDGEQVFQKGKGVWVAPRFVKVTYAAGMARLEAWVDAMGSEQGLDGVVAAAAKGPLKKDVQHIEQILQQPGVGGAPVQEASVQQEPARKEAVFCTQCGAPVTSGLQCDVCGTPVYSGAAQQYSTVSAVEPPVTNAIPAGVHVTKKVYFQKYASDSFNSNVKTLGILGYVLCGMAAVQAVVNPLVLLDVAILLGLTLGMHLGKSKGCAIGILVYAGVSFAIALISQGMMAGWGWIALGGYSMIVFNNEEKRYKKLMEEQNF